MKKVLQASGIRTKRTRNGELNVRLQGEPFTPPNDRPSRRENAAATKKQISCGRGSRDVFIWQADVVVLAPGGVFGEEPV